MIPTTTDDVDGVPVGQHMGFTFGDAVLGFDIHSDLFASIRSIAGDNKPLPMMADNGTVVKMGS